MGSHINDTNTMHWEVCYVHLPGVSRSPGDFSRLQRRKSADKPRQIDRDRITKNNGCLTVSANRLFAQRLKTWLHRPTRLNSTQLNSTGVGRCGHSADQLSWVESGRAMCLLLETQLNLAQLDRKVASLLSVVNFWRCSQTFNSTQLPIWVSTAPDANWVESNWAGTSSQC